MSDVCFIDGSNMSKIDFTTAVIDYAVSRGFEIDEETYRADICWLDSEEDDEDRVLDIIDALDWTFQDALFYLDDIDLAAGHGWYVKDRSLFIEEV